jgi:hypothetical protein
MALIAAGVAFGPSAAAAEAQDAAVQVFGTVRLRYLYQDWTVASRDKLGEFDFELFQLNAAGKHERLSYSAEYRWYGFMDVVHHAWLGYASPRAWELQLGVHAVPFGLGPPPLASRIFFGSNYYLGLEEDYDTGIKYLGRSGPWNLALAFYKNPERRNSADKARFSFDLVIAGDQANEETNQLNARLAHIARHGDGFQTELGGSLQAGQIYNRTTAESGHRWAAALHVDTQRGPWQLQLQLTQYRFDPANPPGVSDDTVLVGAFLATESIPAEATSFAANLAYSRQLQGRFIDRLYLYNGYSFVFDKSGDAEPTHMNVLGGLITSGPFFAYTGWTVAQNQTFMNGSLSGRSDDWNTRININLGYYFRF